MKNLFAVNNNSYNENLGKIYIIHKLLYIITNFENKF